MRNFIIWFVTLENILCMAFGIMMIIGFGLKITIGVTGAIGLNCMWKKFSS